jgi:hypothetical protein
LSNPCLGTIRGIHRQHGDLISLLSVFQNGESGLETIPVNNKVIMRNSIKVVIVIEVN